MAEAIFFFLVPDVLLTLIAARALRPAIKATLAALAGALVGGAMMYAFGSNAPDKAKAFLDYIPAISPQLIERVVFEIDQHGLMAVMLGPIKGIPYKIYAVEWGARGGSFIAFLLISIPARSIRFLLAALAARTIARLIEPLTRHSSRVEIAILAIIWIGFYIFYFLRFGR
jgi:membrane protein YqaA with SNARE-associated domain